MPFVQRVVEPKYLSRTSLWSTNANGKPLVSDDELEAVTNNTLSNALRQLASLMLIANDIFTELNKQLLNISEKSEKLQVKIGVVDTKLQKYDPKIVTVPESDISTFAALKHHYAAPHDFTIRLFSAVTRPTAVQNLYESASKTPVHLMRQMDRWRRDGHRSSRFFLCTPVLGAKRRKIRNKIDIDIETRMPAAVEELRRWTSTEALGDITITLDCLNRIAPNTTCLTDITDGTIASDDEGLDHKLPSPEEQIHVVALKFPAEIVQVDVSGKSFDRMSGHRRSLLHGECLKTDGTSLRRRPKLRRPRNRRRNTLAGTDQREIRDAVSEGEEVLRSSDTINNSPIIGAVARSRSSDILRTSTKKEFPEPKKSHFNTLKQWGISRLRILKSSDSKSVETRQEDADDINIYETVTMRRRRSVEKEKLTRDRMASGSSSEKSTVNHSSISNAINLAVKLRESSMQSRLRRSGGNKDEPHSSSGNWSASSESGRASIGSEITAHPKSTTSGTTASTNSLNQHAPSSVNSRRRFNINTPTSGSVTSEGTLTPDIIHDLHEDGDSVYSCDTEGYYTSFHMDSGLKTLKEEDVPVTPLHSTSTFSNSPSNTLNAENEYELFGKGSTSTTTSSAGTVCTTLFAAESHRSLVIGPAVPERKSSLSKLSNKDKSPESSLEREYGSDKTGTVKRSPSGIKAKVVAMIHKQSDGEVSPDSGHNTSNSPILSISSPNGQRSGSEFEFSESSDMEGSDRIERIRVKTAINSSRIPSMCVITPPHSDDESIKSNLGNVQQINITSENTEKYELKDCIGINFNRSHLHFNNEKLTDNQSTNSDLNVLKSSDNNMQTNNLNKLQLINVNPQTGYATIETVDPHETNKTDNIVTVAKIDADNKRIGEFFTNTSKVFRASSPSGGTVTIKGQTQIKTQSQPIFKASLMPLNNMLGRLKNNLSSLAHRRDSKSPNKENENDGEYVTIADVRNNNEKRYKRKNDVNENLSSLLCGKAPETEYVSLNELPCNDHSQNLSNNDSLERPMRQGARVTLNAEGKVVYSSDSLKRRKNHTTFEPGPFVKQITTTQSPLPNHRMSKTVRPVTSQNQSRSMKTESSRPLSPQLGKLVIRASPGMTTPTSEVIRMPPSTIVTPSLKPLSPTMLNSNPRGAYVHMQETTRSSVSSPKEEGKIDPPNPNPTKPQTKHNNKSYNQNETGKIKRSDSYRIANSPLTISKTIYIEKDKIGIEDAIEIEIAADLWRERINYPATVSPKLCEKQCHIYSTRHAQELLIASTNRLPISTCPENQARVLSISTCDTEIW